MERARRDKQHMVRSHRPVFGRHGGAFDQRQQIALHAFARHRTAAHIGHRDLVDLVQKHDPVGFRIRQRHPRDIVGVHPLFGFFIHQPVPRFGHFQLLPLGWLAAERLAHHFAEVDHGRAAAHAGDVHLHRGLIGDLDFHLNLVHRVFDDPLAETLARRLAGAFANQRLQQAVHRRRAGGLAHGLAAAVFLQPDRVFHQIAGNLFHIAPDITDLGELGRLHLHERSLSQLGQAPADLGLAAASGADHQDILGGHLIAQFRAEPLPPPTGSQRHRDGALGIGLPHDMFVQRSHDGLRSEIIGHLSCLLPFPLAGGGRGVGTRGQSLGQAHPQPLPQAGGELDCL